MLTAELVSSLPVTVVSGGMCAQNITGVYIGDTLSRAMSRVKAGGLWITVTANRNTLAVAEMTRAAAVVLAEGTRLTQEDIKTAEEHHITVLSTEKSAYEIAVLTDGLLYGKDGMPHE